MFKVRVKDFQSIADASITVDGFTVITGPNNSGKALKNGTRVVTPSGVTSVEMLKVGDLVIAGDGKPTLVEGVYPQGIRPTWKVSFDDGRSVVVDGEHLWDVSIGDFRFPKKGKAQRWETLSTHQIVDRVGMGPTGQMRPAIPAAGAVEYLESDIPLHPYLVGVLLGDGCLGKATPRFSTSDSEILDFIEDILPGGIHLKRQGSSDNYRLSGPGSKKHPNPITQACLKMGIALYSHEKFIPSCYKYNTIKVRVGILQGLMDTDGTVSKEGEISFCTTSCKLADDVAELVWSLGGKARKRIKNPMFTHKGEHRRGRVAYIVGIRLPSVVLFRLSRKLCRVKAPIRRNDPLMVSFTRKPPAECTCIRVAHPSSLFQIEGHLVTHNSALMRAIRGAFQNTRGSGFVRHKKAKTSVEVEFSDGNKLEWSKGTAKSAKPTYVINNGSPIHPGQAVPDEVRDLGIKPIMAGGRDIWPQFAPQFTGQIFLLDQPGSVLAEAVADVERVSQLNQALKMSESDRRTAGSTLKVRMTDRNNLTAELERFKGLDDLSVEVQDIEQGLQKAAVIEKAVLGLSELRGRLNEAREGVMALEGIEDVEVPSEDSFLSLKDVIAECDDLRVLRDRWDDTTQRVENLSVIEDVEVPPENSFTPLVLILDEVEDLRVLRDRHQDITQRVEDLSEVEDIEVDFDFKPIQRFLDALGVLQDLKSRYESAVKRVTNQEGLLAKEETNLENAEKAVAEKLDELGECPVCGSTLGVPHEHQ